MDVANTFIPGSGQGRMRVLMFVLGILGFAGFLMAATGCTAQPKPVLAGRISMTSEWRPVAYLVRPRTFTEIAGDFLGQVIDSASIDADGRFAFQALSVPAEGMLVQLTLVKKGARFATQLYDAEPARANYLPLVLWPDKSIVLSGDANGFQGSAATDAQDAANAALFALRDLRIRAHEILVHAADGLDADSLIMEKEAAERQYRQALMGFADTTTQLAAALVACRWIAPDGDYERSAEFIVAQCTRWQERATGSPFVTQLCAAGDATGLPVLVGDTMPDMPLPMLTGDTQQLFELLGGELTLFDVWASWCAPCRRENRDILVPLYAAHAAKGFNIVAYGLESSRSAWQAAVQKDGATWSQASHLEGDAGPVMERLRLRTIPANFLLDAQGRVVAKNLHGEELVRFVERWMR
jgi:thiol-disulfide isomerase/thioredoxin